MQFDGRYLCSLTPPCSVRQESFKNAGIIDQCSQRRFEVSTAPLFLDCRLLTCGTDFAWNALWPHAGGAATRGVPKSRANQHLSVTVRDVHKRAGSEVNGVLTVSIECHSTSLGLGNIFCCDWCAIHFYQDASQQPLVGFHCDMY